MSRYQLAIRIADKDSPAGELEEPDDSPIIKEIECDPDDLADHVPQIGSEMYGGVVFAWNCIRKL